MFFYLLYTFLFKKCSGMKRRKFLSVTPGIIGLNFFFFQQAEEQMAEIRYRCEVAEKKRARSALERFQIEKSDALQKASEEAEKNKQEALKNLTETLARKLRNEAALQRELAVGEALAVARVILNVYVKFISSVSVQGLDDSVYKYFNFYFSQEKCRASSTRINRRNKTRMRKKICSRSVKSCAGPPEQSE